MARVKSAYRQFFVAKRTGDINSADWKRLGKNITQISPENSEESEKFADFAGDGTEVDDVTSISIGFKAEGYRDEEDEAQNIIAETLLNTGEGREIWFATVSPGGKALRGPATCSEVVDGGGEAAQYETFEAKISFTVIPEKGTSEKKEGTKLTPGFNFQAGI